MGKVEYILKKLCFLIFLEHDFYGLGFLFFKAKKYHED